MPVVPNQVVVNSPLGGSPILPSSFPYQTHASVQLLCTVRNANTIDKSHEIPRISLCTPKRHQQDARQLELIDLTNLERRRTGEAEAVSCFTLHRSVLCKLN